MIDVRMLMEIEYHRLRVETQAAMDRMVAVSRAQAAAQTALERLYDPARVKFVEVLAVDGVPVKR